MYLVKPWKKYQFWFIHSYLHVSIYAFSKSEKSAKQKSSTVKPIQFFSLKTLEISGDIFKLHFSYIYSSEVLV